MIKTRCILLSCTSSTLAVEALLWLKNCEFLGGRRPHSPVIYWLTLSWPLEEKSTFFFPITLSMYDSMTLYDWNHRTWDIPRYQRWGSNWRFHNRIGSTTRRPVPLNPKWGRNRWRAPPRCPVGPPLFWRRHCGYGRLRVFVAAGRVQVLLIFGYIILSYC